MIVEYHRPESLDDALGLLGRTDRQFWPMGGGTLLNRPSDEDFGVVDLQALGLDIIQMRGKSLEIGATTTLQQLVEFDIEGFLPMRALQKAIMHEATTNLRGVATVAGTLVASDGRSPFAVAMLALDTELFLQPEDQVIPLGDFLPLRTEHLQGWLITRVRVPSNAVLAYEYVARSPADKPVICAAVASWQSGRVRVALGGFGNAPSLAFDGMEITGVEEAARNACYQAGDKWASTEYRLEIAPILVGRCIEQLNS